MNIQYIIIILLFCNLRLPIFVFEEMFIFIIYFFYIHFVEYISRHAAVALLCRREGREPITTGGTRWRHSLVEDGGEAVTATFVDVELSEASAHAASHSQTALTGGQGVWEVKERRWRG